MKNVTKNIQNIFTWKIIVTDFVHLHVIYVALNITYKQTKQSQFTQIKTWALFTLHNFLCHKQRNLLLEKCKIKVCWNQTRSFWYSIFVSLALFVFQYFFVSHFYILLVSPFPGLTIIFSVFFYLSISFLLYLTLVFKHLSCLATLLSLFHSSRRDSLSLLFSLSLSLPFSPFPADYPNVWNTIYEKNTDIVIILSSLFHSVLLKLFAKQYCNKYFFSTFL